MLNLAVVKRVKDATGTDLCNPLCGKRTLAECLLEDYVLLGTVLAAVCAKQAEERKIAAEDFLAAFRDDVLDAAAVALLEELVDFFPRSRRALVKTTYEISLQALRDKDELGLRLMRPEQTISGEEPSVSPVLPE